MLAEIADLYGPGFTAQMAYYETPAGAKVFAAGVLDFGGSATTWPVRRLLENLWARLAAPSASASRSRSSTRAIRPELGARRRARRSRFSFSTRST